MNKDNFVRTDPNLSIGTSLIINSPRSVGDFLSRIWANYGPPDGIQFEGFDYTFKHVPSGLIFTAYSAGSGPAYGGKPEDKEKLMSIIDQFEALLESTKPADCDIEYDTDFGKVRAGAKGGEPFEVSVEEEGE